VQSIRPCFYCRGGQPGCPECKGTDEIPIHTCPRRLIRSEHRAACLLAVEIEHGVLPTAGGLLDQAAQFVEALPLLLNELDHWRQVWMKRARSKGAGSGGH
jgi:hypothetical protein